MPKTKFITLVGRGQFTSRDRKAGKGKFCFCHYRQVPGIRALQKASQGGRNEGGEDGNLFVFRSCEIGVAEGGLKEFLVPALTFSKPRWQRRVKDHSHGGQTKTSISSWSPNWHNGNKIRPSSDSRNRGPSPKNGRLQNDPNNPSNREVSSACRRLACIQKRVNHKTCTRRKGEAAFSQGRILLLEGRVNSGSCKQGRSNYIIARRGPDIPEKNKFVVSTSTSGLSIQKKETGLLQGSQKLACWGRNGSVWGGKRADRTIHLRRWARREGLCSK